MEAESIHVGATGIIGAFTTVLGFFGIRMVNQVDANTKKLNSHELEDAQKYIPRTEVKESLDRIHNRIDSVSEDIKTLLQRHS